MKTLNNLIQIMRSPQRFVLVLLIIAVSQLSLAQTTTVTYLHHDALGSAVAASDEEGNLLWRKNYMPYGTQIEGSDTEEKVSYTGHSIDKDLDLTYMKARYYDQELGRFISIDPAGVLSSIENETDMFNRYLYAGNNPYKYIDPDGESKKQPKRAVTAQRVGYGSLINHLIKKFASPDSKAYKFAVEHQAQLRKDLIGMGPSSQVSVPKWKGPADYSSIPDPKDLTKTKPTPRQVQEMKRLNREQNDGLLRSDMDGTVLVDSKKSVRGVTPPSNEAQIDHIEAVANGGTRNNSNLQILSRKQNREKSDK